MSLIIRLFEGSRANYKVIEKRLARAVYVGRRTKESVGTYHFRGQFHVTLVATRVNGRMKYPPPD